MTEQTILWVVFGALVLAMLVLDLGVFHRKVHVVKVREAVVWTAIWILLALGFNLAVLYLMGDQKALEFLTGYLIEKSLSIDNVFVFLMIFSYFRVPELYQHRVLFWGVLSALTMRAAMIAAGIALIEQFHWMIYIFGGFLILTGARMAVQKETEIHPERNPVLRLFRKLVTVTENYEGARFFVRRNGLLLATPLFVVLLVVETTDLIFAVDSVPAIMAVTQDPFIIYTSNVFAMLGLRALYFAIAGMAQRFHYLHYGLAAVLVFVGTKMTISDFYKIPVPTALAVVGSLLLIAAIASLIRPKQDAPME